MTLRKRWSGLLLLLGALAPGQIMAAAAPAAPAAPSAATNVNVSGNGTVTLRLPDIGVYDAVLIYQKLTGKSAILPDGISADQRMTIMAPEPVPTNTAVQMLTSALLLNGYALMPDEDGRVKVVVTKTDNPRGAGAPVYTGPASALPQDVAVITYFMPFNYLSAAEADTVFRAQAALNSPYGAIVPVPSARALLITENVAAVRQFIAIKDLIDIPRLDMRVEFVPLVSANSNTVVDAVNDLLMGKNANPQDSTNLNLSFGDLAAADVPTRNVRLLADARTNRVIIIAPAAAMPVLRSFVEKFDDAGQSAEPTEHKLKYVTASDVLPILRTALVEPGKTGDIDSSAANSTSNFSSSSTSGYGTSSSYGSTNTTDNSGSKDVSARVAVKQDTDRATSVIVGKTRLIADNRTNTIVVIGPSSSTKTVQQVLAVVDRPPKQVYLATVIGQMSNTGTQELGVDILQRFRGSPSFGAGTTSSPTPVVGPLNPQNLQIGTNPPTPGVNVYGLGGNTIAFYVQALQQTNRFRILSRPSVYTSNNKKAIISSGSQQPVPSSTQSNLVNTGNTTNSTVLNTNVEYKNVVLELAVVPLINANNEVTLNIAQRNDSLGDNVVVGSTTARAINTQELTTSITVANGQTVVLGGLLSDRDDFQRVGVPLLSDIPILGLLFSSTRKTTNKAELIILIQPIVIESPELAQLQRDDKVAPAGLDQQAVKFLNEGNGPPKPPGQETKEFLKDALGLPSSQ